MARSESDRARARLRRWLALFFLALAVPGALLVYRAYDQLKWESFRRQQILAQDLAERVDRRLLELVRTEEARPPEDYGFLVGPGDASRLEGRRSPLATFPPATLIPGLLGWFEVGEDGRFSTPWVPGPGVSPTGLGIAPEELAQRQAAAHRIESVLVGNRLADTQAGGAEAAPRERRQPDAAPSPAATTLAEGPLARDERVKDEAKQASGTRLSQAAFERLAAQAPERHTAAGRPRSLGQVEDLALDSGLAKHRQTPARPPAPESPPAAEARLEPEAEANQTFSSQAAHDTTEPAPRNGPVRLFALTQEPFRLARLDSGHLVLFRRALSAGEQVIQGLLLDLGPFLAGLVGEPFAASPLAGTADLTLAHRGEILTTWVASKTT
ncbi:MAG: sensor histidine kinase, partial [Bdellovibrio bacteriovorus]